MFNDVRGWAVAFYCKIRVRFRVKSGLHQDWAGLSILELDFGFWVRVKIRITVRIVKI